MFPNNYKIKFKRPQQKEIWGNLWVKEDIKREIKYFFNKNENITYQTLK